MRIAAIILTIPCSKTWTATSLCLLSSLSLSLSLVGEMHRVRWSHTSVAFLLPQPRFWLPIWSSSSRCCFFYQRNKRKIEKNRRKKREREKERETRNVENACVANQQQKVKSADIFPFLPILSSFFVAIHADRAGWATCVCRNNVIILLSHAGRCEREEIRWFLCVSKGSLDPFVTISSHWGFSNTHCSACRWCWQVWHFCCKVKWDDRLYRTMCNI